MASVPRCGQQLEVSRSPALPLWGYPWCLAWAGALSITPVPSWMPVVASDQTNLLEQPCGSAQLWHAWITVHLGDDRRSLSYIAVARATRYRNLTPAAKRPESNAHACCRPKLQVFRTLLAPQAQGTSWLDGVRSTGSECGLLTSWPCPSHRPSRPAQARAGALLTSAFSSYVRKPYWQSTQSRWFVTAIEQVRCATGSATANAKPCPARAGSAWGPVVLLLRCGSCLVVHGWESRYS